MGVTVERREPAEDGSTDSWVEAGHHVEVVDGALEVLDTVDGARVALFPAGTWISAQVED